MTAPTIYERAGGQEAFEKLTKVFYAKGANMVIFVIMFIVLLVKPAGLFGQEK